MVEKIINLLNSDSPVNWELAIQFSEGLGICKRVCEKLTHEKNGYFYRFLRLPFFAINIQSAQRCDIDSIQRHVDRLDLCGLDFTINYEWSKDFRDMNSPTFRSSDYCIKINWSDKANGCLRQMFYEDIYESIPLPF